MTRKKHKSANTPPATDLVVLAADKNTSAAIEGILNRPKSLGIRELRFEIHVHPESDPGCLKRSTDLLRLFAKTCAHGLVVFDHEGCGQENEDCSQLEQRVQSSLAANGWNDRADVIVIDPELETWVWSDSPHVAGELGWKEQASSLKVWLQEKGFLNDILQTKPDRPKEAMEAVLKRMKKPRSSSIYRSLASKVGFDHCQDGSFLKLKSILQRWFALP